MTIVESPPQSRPPAPAPAPPPPVGPAPSKARWVLVALLPAVAVLTAVLWLWLNLSAIGAATDGFARAPAPGQLAIDVHPDTYYVYVEGAQTPRAAHVVVSGENGQALAVQSWSPGPWYDHGGKESRGVAAFKVPIGTVGRATVVLSGDIGADPDTTFAVSSFNVDRFEQVQRLGVIALVVVNLGAAIAIAVAPAVRRRRPAA